MVRKQGKWRRLAVATGVITMFAAPLHGKAQGGDTHVAHHSGSRAISAPACPVSAQLPKNKPPPHKNGDGLLKGRPTGFEPATFRITTRCSTN